MTNRNVVLAGSGMVALGLFLPIVTFPMVGVMNLFSGTSWVALSLLTLVLITVLVCLRLRVEDAVWPGIAIGVLLAFRFAMLQYLISNMRSSLDELKGNPFAGVAQAAMSTVQIQWGWLVLVGGAAAIVYAAIQQRREAEEPPLALGTGSSQNVALASIVLALLAPAWELYHSHAVEKPAATTLGIGSSSEASSAPVDVKAAQATREQADYAARFLKVYDLRAKYYDSMLDGRVPGVDFKVKNSGDRTLSKVTVRVVFQDKDGKPIAEEDFYPVLVTSSGFGDDNRPLRPNYIWQQESGKFYSAKSVPNEWQAGRATATITEVEFADAK